MTKEIVIVAAQRTPMGGLQGGLASKSADELGAVAIAAAMKKASIQPESVDEVYMGNVLSAAVGQAPARQAALGAGLGDSVPTTTINKVCGSGMKAVMFAADQIKVGSADVVVAGGMESMTNAPYMLDKARSGYRFGNSEIYDHMFVDGLKDAYSGEAMGVHAQNTADDYELTREAMDEFALRSLARAQEAIKEGWFADEIAPVTIKSRKGETVVDTDEQPMQARPEKIPHLRAAFTKDGTITAANASSISDGASALILMSAEKAKELGVTPLAKIVDYVSHAQQPSTFTCAPIGAMKTLLSRQNLSPEDIDLVEINEAFAAQVLAVLAALDDKEYCQQHLGLRSAVGSISLDRLNIHGGGVSLGHPVGASGARIVLHLAKVLGGAALWV